MAKRTITTFTDDLDGTEATAGTIEFAFDGQNYIIDLSEENKEKFIAAMTPFINAARKAPARRKTASGSGMSKEELQKIRAWAEEQGIEIAARGRIKKEIIEQYKNK